MGISGLSNKLKLRLCINNFVFLGWAVSYISSETTQATGGLIFNSTANTTWLLNITVANETTMAPTTPASSMPWEMTAILIAIVLVLVALMLTFIVCILRRRRTNKQNIKSKMGATATIELEGDPEVEKPSKSENFLPDDATDLGEDYLVPIVSSGRVTPTVQLQIPEPDEDDYVGPDPITAHHVPPHTDVEDGIYENTPLKNTGQEDIYENAPPYENMSEVRSSLETPDDDTGDEYYNCTHELLLPDRSSS